MKHASLLASPTTTAGGDVATAFVTGSSFSSSSSLWPFSSLTGAGDSALIGSGYADTINGNLFANMLYGGQGNDTIFGAGGNDFIDGGFGIDTAKYKGTSSSYSITASPGGSGVEVLSAAEGQDTESATAAAVGHFVHVYVEPATGRPAGLPAEARAVLAALQSPIA